MRRSAAKILRRVAGRAGVNVRQLKRNFNKIPRPSRCAFLERLMKALKKKDIPPPVPAAEVKCATCGSAEVRVIVVCKSCGATTTRHLAGDTLSLKTMDD